MSSMTARDRKLLGVLILLLMVGVLGIWFPKAKKAWEKEKKLWQQQTLKLVQQQAEIDRRPAIQAQYDELRARMPLFPAGKSVDTHWLPIMDNTARANNVTIAQRAIGKETEVGEVTELELECRDWEARLDSLVWFLYDIENRDDAMIDVRAIHIRPDSKKPGFLQGTFTLNCAYMRQDD